MGGFACSGNQLLLGLFRGTLLYNKECTALISCLFHASYPLNVDFKTQYRVLDPQALPQDLLSTHHLTVFRLTPGCPRVISVLQPSKPQGLEGPTPLLPPPFTLSAGVDLPLNQCQRGREAGPLFGSGPSINDNHFGEKGQRATVPHSVIPLPSPICDHPSLPPHLPSGAYYGGLRFKGQPCGRQNNGSTRYVHVLIPRACEYVR